MSAGLALYYSKAPGWFGRTLPDRYCFESGLAFLFRSLNVVVVDTVTLPENYRNKDPRSIPADLCVLKPCRKLHFKPQMPVLLHSATLQQQALQALFLCRSKTSSIIAWNHLDNKVVHSDSTKLLSQ